MISQAFYNSHNEDWWKGKTVRTLVEMSNGWFTAAAGTEFTVTAKQGGLHLRRMDPCPCCGLRGHISKVAPVKLELVE